MALEPAGEMPLANSPMIREDGVSKTVSVTDTSPTGMAAFLAGWRSMVTGLRITGKHALTKPKTVRYPAQRVTLSSRWRGALALRGALGIDDIPLLSAPSVEYNALIERLYAEERLAPCIGNCPANVDVRGQNFYAAEGRVAEAYEVVRDRNIMPGVLGRICHHPCETACRRNYYDEPVAVRPLHRFVAEGYAAHRAERIRPLPRTRGQRVGIVGAGPSGLAAAYDLLKLGYGVTVYEKESKPGGALYSGVPSYRLPREVLHQEIDDIVSMGVELRCGIEVGRDVPMDRLTGDYDAVLVATGLQVSRRLPIPGADAEGVWGALEFLKAANWEGDAGVQGKRVFVIGGGNVAVDVARCALRVGAAEVRLGCLEGDHEMPCHPWEIEEALEEGVVAMCGQGPNDVLTDEQGRVRGMRLRTCVSVFDQTGRFAPEFADEYTEVDCDVVVFSIGQGSDLAALVTGTDLQLDQRGNLVVEGSVLTTTQPNVFACGEVVTGPGSCIGSIATGHEAATSIHRFLSGSPIDGERVSRPVPIYDSYQNAEVDDLEPTRRRAVMQMAKPEDRRKDFRQVELGMTRLEAISEAQRCLRCQSEVCVGCGFCARTCPDYAIHVERVDDPGERCLTRYDLDVSKCCFCGLCAEQCPTDALTHTGQYELSFYHRDLMAFDRGEMLRDREGTRATGRGGSETPCRGEEAS